MTKCLNRLLPVIFAAALFSPSLHAQSTTVYAHTIIETGHRILSKCGTDMDGNTAFNYPASEAYCGLNENGVFIVDYCSNQQIFGNPGTDCREEVGSETGSHYYTSVGNGLIMNFEDANSGKCFDQFGHFVSGYFDPFHYGVPSGTGLPQYSEQFTIVPPVLQGAICWSGNDIGIADTFSQPYLTEQVSPSSAQVFVGKSASFSVNIAVNWTLSGPGSVATNSTAATYTPPSTIDTPETATLTGCATDYPTNCDEATISLAPIIVSISPGGTVPVIPGGQQPFTASVTPDDANQAVTWTVISTTGSQAGTIDVNGNYTAPPNDKVVGTQFDTIQACSKADTSRCSSVTASVTQVTISIVSGPTAVLASPGATATYTAAINGTSSTDLAWSIDPPQGAGTIVSNGPGTLAATYTPATVNNLDTNVKIKACLTATICSPQFPVTVSPQVVISAATNGITCSPACGAGETDVLSVAGTGFSSNGSQPSVGFFPNTILYNQNSWNNTSDAGPASFPILYQTTTFQLTLQSNGNNINSSATKTFTVAPVSLTATVTPGSAIVNEGSTGNFSAHFACKTPNGNDCSAQIPQTANWAITCPPTLTSCGSISQDGVYVPPPTISPSVTTGQSISGKACSTQNSSTCGTFSITLQPVNVTVTPPTATLSQCQTLQLSVSALPPGVNQGVVWAIVAPSPGTITPGGLYTAPCSIPTDSSATVKACSVLDSVRCGSSTITLRAPDFSVTTSSNMLGPITAGSTVTVGVSVTPAFGFTGPVSLTTIVTTKTGATDTCPANAKCTFSPNPVTVTGTGSVFSQLTIQTDPTTPGDTYAIVVSGSGGGRNHSATNAPAYLQVSSFTLKSPQPVPASQTIMASTCANYTVTVTDINNYAGTVNLSVSGLPPASTGTLTPPSGIVPPSFSSRLAVCTTAATPAGSYPLITVTGTSGVITQSATVTLNVTNFAVTATPASQSGTVSAPVIFTTTVTPQGGFNGVVNLSQTGCPTNATCTFDPPSLTGGGTSSLIVTLADTTPLNGYTINIAATSGSLVQQTSVTLNVGPGIGLTTANSGIAGRGTTVPISWVYTPNVGTTVSINLLRENSLVQTIASGIVIDNSTYGTQTYNWTVPLNIPIGSGYAIQLVDSSGYKDQSSGFLIIR